MAKYASKVVGQAKAWIGCKESDGSHKKIIDTYNSHKPLARGYKVKYTDSWCAAFVSAVAIVLEYTDIIPTECGCQKMIDLFKDMGCWIENENRKPNPGDIIFYDWHDDGRGDNKGWADHVGIVEKVEGNTITLIEGNYSSAVKRRRLAVNGLYIRGYGTPKYDALEEPAPVEPLPEAWEPAVGDLVQFKGGKHYRTANGFLGFKAAAGQAKITKIVPGKKHPYHLKRTGRKGPYGWVDAETFTKA